MCVSRWGAKQHCRTGSRTSELAYCGEDGQEQRWGRARMGLVARQGWGARKGLVAVQGWGARMGLVARQG